MAILTARAEHSQISAGRYQAEIGIAPKFYISNGIYKPLTNTLGSSGDPSLTLGINELFDFRIRPSLTGNAPILHIGKGAAHVRITPLDTNNCDGVVSGNSITYPAWNNADLRYTVAGHIIRKEILLHAGHPGTFAFRVDEKSNDVDDDLKSGEFKMIPPYMDNPATGAHIEVPLTKTTQGGKRIYTMTLPAGDYSGWILDPTFTSQPDETASADTFMSNTNPTTNYGSADLYIGAYTETDRTLIKFDLTSIPAGATVNTATLELTFKVDHSINARNFYVYRLLRNWVEAQATWNIWSTGNNWTTAGAGSAGNDYDSTILATTNLSATETMSTKKTWSLTPAQIDYLLNGTYTNYGWLLKSEEVVNDNYVFHSSAATTSTYRPKLIIDYTEASTGQPMGLRTSAMNYISPMRAGRMTA